MHPKKAIVLFIGIIALNSNILLAATEISPLTLAQAARRPAQAGWILSQRPVAPGNIIRTLLRGVEEWPRVNVEMVYHRSLIRLSEAEAVRMIDGFRDTTPPSLKASEILLWSDGLIAEPTQAVFAAWMSKNPIMDITHEEFQEKWYKLRVYAPGSNRGAGDSGDSLGSSGRLP